MRNNSHSEPRQRRLGWVWVWGAFAIYFAFEIARLS